MKWIIFVLAIFAVLMLTAGGRVLIVWILNLMKPFLGIFMFLLSAHYTIIRHTVMSRALIYPSISRKTTYREKN
jgi:hypothetical protein